MKLDLNCDLGEGEPAARTRALMRWITSANVACGGHAGNPASMARCCRLAAEFGVRLGAHPGFANRADFGRGMASLTSGELEALLREQVGALEHIARKQDLVLHHIKLHGALYHAAENDSDLARSYLQVVKKRWPKVKIYALAGGTVVKAAGRANPQVWGEAFADRAYQDDGRLVPRTEPGALLHDPELARSRARELATEGVCQTASGARLRLGARTLCVHGDTPGSIKLARAAAEGAGLVTAPPRSLRSNPGSR